MIETSLICLDLKKSDYLGWEKEPKVKREKKDCYHIFISENDHIHLFSCSSFRKSYFASVASFRQKISKPFSCSLHVGDNNPLNIMKNCKQ